MSEQQLNELYEIADGAWGDGAWMRGLAIAKIRGAGREYPQKEHRHSWSEWKEIGRTGDWFHPLIVERTCLICGATETDEH